MKTSTELNELADALSNLQSDISNPVKDAQSHHNRYASFPSVLNTIRPHLRARGLSIIQTATKATMQGYPTHVVVVTRLLHKSGQWIEDEISAPVSDKARNSVQEMGSIISYLKRYAIQGLVLITGDDDDDGQAAGHIEQNEPVAMPSLDQINKLRDLIAKKGMNIKTVTSAFNVHEIEDLSIKQYEEAHKKISAKADKETS